MSQVASLIFNVSKRRFSNMVLGHNGDGINEVKDARVDNTGYDHKTLQDRLYHDYSTLDAFTKRLKAVDENYKEYRATEYRFEPKEQEPEFITDLSPYTNAVMQSFWVDPRTKIIYMTQARPGNHYMLSRLKPNGQFIDRLLVKTAVTVHTMRIDTLMENYGFIQLYWTVTKQQVCTFPI